MFCTLSCRTHYTAAPLDEIWSMFQPNSLKRRQLVVDADVHQLPVAWLDSPRCCCYSPSQIPLLNGSERNTNIKLSSQWATKSLSSSRIWYVRLWRQFSERTSESLSNFWPSAGHNGSLDTISSSIVSLLQDINSPLWNLLSIAAPRYDKPGGAT